MDALRHLLVGLGQLVDQPQLALSAIVQADVPIEELPHHDPGWSGLHGAPHTLQTPGLRVHHRLLMSPKVKRVYEMPRLGRSEHREVSAAPLPSLPELEKSCKTCSQDTFP